MKHKRPHVHTRTSKRGKKFTVNPDIMKGKKPSNSLMTRYKHLPYKKLKKQFLINPHADDDNDGVINKKDCRPWDKTKQHIPTQEIPSYEFEEKRNELFYDIEEIKDEIEKRNNEIEQSISLFDKNILDKEYDLEVINKNIYRASLEGDVPSDLHAKYDNIKSEISELKYKRDDLAYDSNLEELEEELEKKEKEYNNLMQSIPRVDYG
jgi:hypothetical protein